MASGTRTECEPRIHIDLFHSAIIRNIVFSTNRIERSEMFLTGFQHLTNKHMYRCCCIRAFSMILLAAGFALAGVENGNADMQEPLQRYDPYAESPQFLASIRGKPRLGFPSEVYDRFQRVSDKNWFVGLKSSVAWMEPDYKSGEVAVKQIIEAVPPWAVSADSKLIFTAIPYDGQLERGKSGLELS